MRYDQILSFIALIAAAVGCGGTTNETQAESASGAGGDASPTATSTSTTATGSASTGAGGSGQGGGYLTGPGVTGFIHDEDGVPIGNTSVLACSAASCLFGTSLENGRFAFELTPPLDLVIKTEEDLSVDPRRGAGIVPVQLTGNDPLDIGGVLVPSLPDGVVLGPKAADPQTLDVGDGLTLTVSRADLSPPLGHDLLDIAARVIPEEHLHPLPGLGAEQIVAVYALHPFAATSTSVVAVRAPSTLPAGTKVSFRTISWLDGHLSDPASGTADGAFVETDPSQGIYDLTWLVISK